MVEIVGGKIMKGRWVGDPRNTREEKDSEVSRLIIQDISEKDTGEERNKYSGWSRDRRIYESEKVIK